MDLIEITRVYEFIIIIIRFHDLFFFFLLSSFFFLLSSFFFLLSSFFFLLSSFFFLLSSFFFLLSSSFLFSFLLLFFSRLRLNDFFINSTQIKSKHLRAFQHFLLKLLDLVVQLFDSDSVRKLVFWKIVREGDQRIGKKKGKRSCEILKY